MALYSEHSVPVWNLGPLYFTLESIRFLYWLQCIGIIDYPFDRPQYSDPADRFICLCCKKSMFDDQELKAHVDSEQPHGGVFQL